MGGRVWWVVKVMMMTTYVCVCIMRASRRNGRAVSPKAVPCWVLLAG